jgi:hypothetical protein
MVEGIDLDSIRLYLAPGDRVWSAGTVGARLYWLTGCRSATRYLYTGGGAAMGGNLDPSLLLADLRATPPRCVVLGPEWTGFGGLPGGACPPAIADYLRAEFDPVLTADDPTGGVSALLVRKSGAPGADG